MIAQFQIAFVVVCLIAFGIHLNILFIVQVEILELINWSYMSLILFIIDSQLVINFRTMTGNNQQPVANELIEFEK